MILCETVFFKKARWTLSDWFPQSSYSVLKTALFSCVLLQESMVQNKSQVSFSKSRTGSPQADLILYQPPMRTRLLCWVTMWMILQKTAL